MIITPENRSTVQTQMYCVAASMVSQDTVLDLHLNMDDFKSIIHLNGYVICHVQFLDDLWISEEESVFQIISEYGRHVAG